MKKLLLLSMILGLGSIHFGQESFLGSINGLIYENGAQSSFTWKFEENLTTYSLEFDADGIQTKVDLQFDGDTTAVIVTYQKGNEVNRTEITPSQLLQQAPVFLAQHHSVGEKILDHETTKYQVRTKEQETVSWIAPFNVNWNGADLFFRQDVGFILGASNNGFPMKTLTTNLKGELIYSFDVTGLEKN